MFTCFVNAHQQSIKNQNKPAGRGHKVDKLCKNDRETLSASPINRFWLITRSLNTSKDNIHFALLE